MPRLTTITKRQDFLSAAKHGNKIVTSTFVLQAHTRAAIHPAGKTPRIGLTVTKKMGNAVVRNRIKRRLRAALTQANPPLKDYGDYVFISRLGAFDCPFEKLLTDIQFAFRKLQGKSAA